MPYIRPQIREHIDPYVDALLVVLEERGEYNYVITRLLHAFIKRRGGLGYAQINDAVGIIECAKMELYRAVAAPYEDTKKEQNGQISELDGAGV